MKKIIIIILAVVACVSVPIFVVMGVENKAISYEEVIENIAGDIRVEEQRRFDLIPSLAKCVKQYDEHEYKTLNDIVKARNAGDTTVSFDHVTTIVKAIIEAYPDLKSQNNYKEFMNELSITENRLAELRKHYNREVTRYKNYIRVFPSKQILSLVRYKTRDYERLEFENSSVDALKNLFD